MARRKNKGNKAHYVDNSVFLEAMIQYKSEYDDAKKNEKELPQISEYFGIENCLHYIHNFNPEKSNNPFAYFTQIIYYAFIRRIQKEKKQLYIKYKSMQNYDTIPGYMDIDKTNDVPNPIGDYKNSDFRIVVDEFVDTFEKSKKKKAVVKKKESNLELFMRAIV